MATCPVNGAVRKEKEEVVVQAEYPRICPGGGLLIAWQLKGKKVLLVGGGPVAAGRLVNVKDADCHLTVLCPSTGLCPEMKYRILTEKVVDHYIDDIYTPSFRLEGFDMVLTAIDDVELSKSICYRCRDLKIPVNVADVPPECDFYFGSLIRNGPLQVMVSTGGQGPKIASQVRKKVQKAIPSNVGDAILQVGKLRSMLRKKAPTPELGARRMRWMIDVCERWNLDELCEMQDQDMKLLLEIGWNRGYAPTYREIKGGWISKNLPLVNLIPSGIRIRKALFGTCPVVGLPSPYLVGILGFSTGLLTSAAFFLLNPRRS